MNCTWEKIDGRYVCMAKECVHWLAGGGCKLGKISHTCDNMECKFNRSVNPGIYCCMNMDIHLDANGTCMGIKYE